MQDKDKAPPPVLHINVSDPIQVGDEAEFQAWAAASL